MKTLFKNNTNTLQQQHKTILEYEMTKVIYGYIMLLKRSPMSGTVNGVSRFLDRYSILLIFSGIAYIWQSGECGDHGVLTCHSYGCDK